jgi:hypothetical protein
LVTNTTKDFTPSHFFLLLRFGLWLSLTESGVS